MKSIIISIIVLIKLSADVSLYLNMPQAKPSKSVNTSFGKELIRLIDSANKQISFAIYGLRAQDEVLQALINAQDRGVSIKGVVDSDTHNNNYYSDTRLLYDNFDIKSDHRSNIMHNKFFIVDDHTLWSGSSNISDTGTGGYNANNTVVIKNSRVVKVYQNEFNQMYYERKFNTHKEINTYKNIKDDNSTISIYFSPKSNTYTNAIKELVDNANEYIYIPIFYLTHKQLAKDLIKAYHRGVEIKIILDASAAGNKYSAHQQLREEGIMVKVENFRGKMHIKSMIIDDKVFISGSMNLTKSGESKNDENTLIIFNTKLTIKYRKYFEQLWKNENIN